MRGGPSVCPAFEGKKRRPYLLFTPSHTELIFRLYGIKSRLLLTLSPPVSLHCFLRLLEQATCILRLDLAGWVGCSGRWRPQAPRGVWLGRPSSPARASNVSPAPAAPAAARRFGEDTAPPPPPSFPSCGHYREEPAPGSGQGRLAGRPRRGVRLALGRAPPSAARRRPPRAPGAPRSCSRWCCSTTTACWRGAGRQRGARRSAWPAAPAPEAAGGALRARPGPGRPRRRPAAWRAAATLPGRLGHHHQRAGIARRPRGEAIGRPPGPSPHRVHGPSVCTV